MGFIRYFTTTVVVFLLRVTCQENFQDYYSCDDNNNCTSLEPDVFNTTDIITVVNEFTNKTDDNNKTDIDYNTYGTYSDVNECTCNLQRNICDINCCCDNDCSSIQKLVFSKCDNVSGAYDPRFCYSSSNIYENDTRSIVDWIQNDFFCIVSTNLPPSYIIQANKPVKTISEANKLTSKFHKWPNITSDVIIGFNLTQILKEGDHLWIRKNNNSKIIRFSLPQSGITNVCTFKNNLQYLKNIRTTCSHMMNEEIGEDFYPRTYYDFTIIKFNSTLNISLINDISKECPKNICLPLQIYMCDEEFVNCLHVLKNDTQLVHDCHFELYSGTQTCQQIVKKVKYNIYHNGTYGISKINLYLHLINITLYISNDNDQLEQTFEVNFYWDQYVQNYSSILSGNPGYQIGKAVLVANVNRTTVNITANVFKFIQNGNNTEDNFLVLPRNHNGYCKLNNNVHYLTEFGYNVRLICKEKFEIKSILTNATVICLRLQKQLFRLWRISEYKNRSVRYVGMFGNSDRYQVGEWLRVMYKFDINATLEKVSGTKNDDKIICNGISNGLKINVLYSNVDLEKNKNQRKIVNVNMDLNIMDSLTFYIIDKDTSDTSIDIRVFTEIMFYDVTGPKLEKFVDPPSFEISLPRDFFYPFMSKSTTLTSSYLLLLLLSFICSVLD